MADAYAISFGQFRARAREAGRIRYPNPDGPEPDDDADPGAWRYTGFPG